MSNSIIPSKIPHSKKTVAALWRLEKTILDSLNFNDVVQEVCDSVLHELGYLEFGYQIVVLSLIDESGQFLKRIAISQTKKAKQALLASPVPFKNITIPLVHEENIMVKALKHRKSYTCTNWHKILSPVFSEMESTKIQKKLGIKASLVYPIYSKNKTIGTLIFSMSKLPHQVTHEERDLIRSFSDMVGLAVQNATLYSQLEDTTKNLEKANRHLKHLDKLKNDFIFVATHELKNPVTAMRGYTSMLLEGMFGDIPPKMKEPIDQLQGSTQQLVDLVNDLLQIARSEAKTLTIYPDEINLCQIVDTIKENVKILADQKGLKLVHTCPQKQFKVKADPQRVKEILNNLLSNAIKYSDSGTISISHELDKTHIITHVTDQGFGISPEEQKKLFTKFYRVEEQAAKGIPGTGLGLYIIKEFIEKMGGKIWLTSEKGIGSTFSFSLPKI